MVKKRRRPDKYNDGDIDERWRPEVVHEDSVLDASEDIYRVAGYQCRKCSFRTSNTGFSGKQSLRAHQKVHVRERRATVPPAFRQIVWTATAAAALIGLALTGPFDILQDVDPLIPGITITCMTVLLAISQVYSVGRAVKSFDRGTIRTASLLINLSRVAGTTALVCGYLGLTSWYWLISTPLLLMIGIPVVSEIGLASLGARRGRFRSPRYAEMLKPRSKDVAYALYDYQSRLRGAVREGRLNPPKAGARLRRHYESLGLPRLWNRRQSRLKAQADIRKADSARKREQEKRRRQRLDTNGKSEQSGAESASRRPRE